MSNILTRAQIEMIVMGGLVLYNNHHKELRDRPVSPASKLPHHRLPQWPLFLHSHNGTGFGSAHKPARRPLARRLLDLL